MKTPQLLYYDLSPRVTAFSSTRHGGYGTGTYAEWNINRYSGDDAAHIEANRAALLELLGSFGRYDLQGQLALIALTQTRIRDEQLWLDQDRRNRCRLYETLGVCTGLALMILVI